MSRPPIFPDDDEGRADFAHHMSRWAHGEESMAEYFARACGISETTVYATARRLGMSVPTNRKKQFREKELVLKEQREGQIPLAIMAWRYNVKEPTIYKWSRDVGLKIKGNTKKERRKWWRDYFADFDLSTAFEKFHQDKIPPYLAILAYHELIASDEVIIWDMSEIPPTVIRGWDDEDFAEAVQDSEPATPQGANVFLAKGKIVRCSHWLPEGHPAHIAPEPEVTTKLRGHPVSPGDRLIYTKPDFEEREVEFVGLQANGSLRVRDLQSNARRGVQRQYLRIPGDEA